MAIWGTYKSFYAIDMACSIITGLPFLGKFKVRQGPIIYIAAEGQYGIVKRVAGWEIANKAKVMDQFGLIGSPFRFADPREAKIAVKEIRELVEQPQAVFIDTLARNFGGDENSTHDMTEFVASMDYISNGLDCAVWSVHHCGKDFSKGPRGNSAFLCSMDFSICCTKLNKRMNVEQIKTKDNEPLRPYHLMAEKISVGEETEEDDMTTLVLRNEDTWESNLNNLNEKERLFYDAIKLKTSWTFQEGLELTGERKSTYQTRLKTLLNAGLIDKTNEGWRTINPHLYQDKWAELKAKNNH